MDRATYNERFSHLVYGQAMCSGGQDLLDFIVKRFFNCLAKNLVLDIMTNEANKTGQLTAKNKRLLNFTV